MENNQRQLLLIGESVEKFRKARDIEQNEEVKVQMDQTLRSLELVEQVFSLRVNLIHLHNEPALETVANANTSAARG